MMRIDLKKLIGEVTEYDKKCSVGRKKVGKELTEKCQRIC